MGLAQTPEESRYELKNQIKESQMFLQIHKVLMLDFHLYLVVSGFLTWVGKTSHISDSDLISAGCYGSCVYERLGEPLGVCSGVKKHGRGVLLGTLVLFRSLHNRTAAICNGGSKSYYLHLFSYITCLGKFCNLCNYLVRY